jgi:hypothetical protein
MSTYTALNKFQKQTLVIELHNQGRTIRQIAEVAQLDDLETLYHEAKYSLSLLLQLFTILKDNRITKDKDTYCELGTNSRVFSSSVVLTSPGSPIKRLLIRCFFGNAESISSCIPASNVTSAELFDI